MSSPNVFAARQTSGRCGKNAIWNLDKNGTLTISGQGEIYDRDKIKQPELKYWDLIRRIIIEDGITCIGEQAFSFTKNVAYIQLPDSLTEIKDHAFLCSSIESISIGKNVTKIGKGAFTFCKNLKFIYVSDDNPNYTCKSGNPNFDGKMLFAKNGSKLELMHCCNWYKTENIDLIIPSNVSEIKTEAFYRCTGLISVEFAGEIVLNCKSFCHCKQLEEIIFCDGSSTADEAAIHCCKNLLLISGCNEVGRNLAKYCNHNKALEVHYYDFETNTMEIVD